MKTTTQHILGEHPSCFNACLELLELSAEAAQMGHEGLSFKFFKEAKELWNDHSDLWKDRELLQCSYHFAYLCVQHPKFKEILRDLLTVGLHNVTDTKVLISHHLMEGATPTLN